MFEYVKLKNYKSFGNVEFNLLDKNGVPKKLLLIYGKNGDGKDGAGRSISPGQAAGTIPLPAALAPDVRG